MALRATRRVTENGPLSHQEGGYGCMLDLCLRGARVPGSSGRTNIGIANGKIVAADDAAREVVDVGGALVTPALVEPHIHLDAVLTVGEDGIEVDVWLDEGIAIWAERVQSLTV